MLFSKFIDEVVKGSLGMIDPSVMVGSRFFFCFSSSSSFPSSPSSPPLLSPSSFLPHVSIVFESGEDGEDFSELMEKTLEELGIVDQKFVVDPPGPPPRLQLPPPFFFSNLCFLFFSFDLIYFYRSWKISRKISRWISLSFTQRILLFLFMICRYSFSEFSRRSIKPSNLLVRFQRSPCLPLVPLTILSFSFLTCSFLISLLEVVICEFHWSFELSCSRWICIFKGPAIVLFFLKFVYFSKVSTKKFVDDDDLEIVTKGTRITTEVLFFFFSSFFLIFLMRV